jgi:hypothetical protein
MTSESPFSNYLTTNNAPSDAEVDGIGGLIADRKEAARGISARLESLAKEAQVLRGQLKQHTHYIEEHKTLVSAIRRLPDNALTRIFVACRNHSGFSPIAISHVSRQWRKLALDEPLLWTKIGAYIRARHTSPEGSGGHPTLERVSAFIERSGTLGLSIHASAEPFDPASREVAQRIHEDLVAILEPTCSRWKTLYVSVSSDSPLMRLLQIPGARAPALESVSIDFEPIDFHRLESLAPGEALIDKPKVDPIINVWSTPSLVVLSLKAMGQSLVDANVALPVNWSTLSYLSLQSSTKAHLTQHQVVPILAACTSLIHLSLTLGDAFGHKEFPEPFPDGPVVEATLPNLGMLELHGSEVALRGMASRLTLPSLTTLITHFNDAAYPASEDNSALAEWLDRFGHQLLAVSFDYVSLTQSALAYCLARLPNVVQLKMVGWTKLSFYPWMFLSKKSGIQSASINDEVLERLTPRHRNDAGAGDSADGDDDTEEDAGEDNEEGSGDDTEDDATVHANSDAGSQDVCLCPKVQLLELHMGPYERVEKALVEMILARYGDATVLELPGGVYPLRQAVLSFNCQKPRKEGSQDIVKEINSVVDPSAIYVGVRYKEPYALKSAEDLFQAMSDLQAKGWASGSSGDPTSS